MDTVFLNIVDRLHYYLKKSSDLGLSIADIKSKMVFGKESQFLT